MTVIRVILKLEIVSNIPTANKRKNIIRGFVKFKKSKKSEKNSEVGGWVKPQFFGEMFGFFVFFFVSPKNQKTDIGVGGCSLDNPIFSRIF